jgi:cell wall-associated NlpC family hydrolase
MTTGADVVAAARAELGTPWMHQARLPGEALDCVGLVIVTARRLGLLPADWDVNGYGRHPDGTLLLQCDQHMQRIGAMELGAVVVVAITGEPQHMGIVGNYRHGGWSLIHAASNARPGRVIETRLMFHRAQQLQALYRLPGVS